jgi:hypothetical protein
MNAEISSSLYIATTRLSTIESSEQHRYRCEALLVPSKINFTLCLVAVGSLNAPRSTSLVLVGL